ncbi:uncharacterized protein BDCG_02954 [Blastomyces dermatitidis ER-3]|uniref:Uncharacterized protein n=1 Tax=Ajellomyces dermatitidis (strain ER-3 / ATCC MYA-2586) TaxID=559297 RepID=A0ABM9YH09_AJEDR|nr:uncharacterized protein BDCG_02954 [Blastomyces dermatitidis ER-3]EEQ87834.2 hypothetical protein BDCG_02954 [Blastomyces dermatitidis ER-3]
MADSIRSRPHTRSRSRVLSIDERPETPSRFEAGLNTAPGMVRPAPRSTRQLDEAGSLDENNGHPGVYRSGGAISNQQMEHLKMTFEIEKERRRVLELGLQLEKLHQQRSSTDRPQDVNNHPATTSTATTATTHNLKVLPNAACKAAAAIPSATPGLPTAACKETAAIPDPSIDNLFIDEEIQPECPLFLVPTNNWWIDYDISARIPTLLVQNTLNSLEPTVESDDPPTSTRNITTVGEASVGDSLEDLPTDPEIAALPIPKNLTHAKASMEWKYYYKACVKESFFVPVLDLKANFVYSIVYSYSGCTSDVSVDYVLDTIAKVSFCIFLPDVGQIGKGGQRSSKIKKIDAYD